MNPIGIWFTTVKIEKKYGWNENYLELSLKLIEWCNFNKNAVLFHVGVGASTLIDELIKLENNIVIASDISSTSLEKLKKRIGIDKDKLKWKICFQ